jgi:5-methylthioadenosine/S-adenosylhomocysteine deaminase
MASLKIKGGTVVTMNEAREVLDADVLIQDDLIAEVGQVNRSADREIDASGRIVLPGLIQSHIHLCQALFRNLADDLPLLEWLKQRIWPLEAAHAEDSNPLSARLGLIELIRGGPTAIVDMGPVRHTGAIFEEIEQSGFRAIGGKCMMARRGTPGRASGIAG